MRYLGGKVLLAKHILPIILENRRPDQWYVEPFAGGMNVICKVQGNRIANDAHPYLIAMWENLVNGWIPKKFTYKTYKKVRDNKDNYSPHFVGWVGFMSFGGKWFGGHARKQPGRDYHQESINILLRQAKELSGTILKNVSYENLEIPHSSIVYCDPPYKGTTKYSYDIDQGHFWNWCRKLARQGHTVFISELEAPKDFKCVFEKRKDTQISSAKDSLKIEKLFTYRYKVKKRK